MPYASTAMSILSIVLFSSFFFCFSFLLCVCLVSLVYVTIFAPANDSGDDGVINSFVLSPMIFTLFIKRFAVWKIHRKHSQFFLDFSFLLLKNLERFRMNSVEVQRNWVKTHVWRLREDSNRKFPRKSNHFSFWQFRFVRQAPTELQTPFRHDLTGMSIDLTEASLSKYIASNLNELRENHSIHLFDSMNGHLLKLVIAYRTFSFTLAKRNRNWNRNR